MKLLWRAAAIPPMRQALLKAVYMPRAAGRQLLKKRALGTRCEVAGFFCMSGPFIPVLLQGFSSPTMQTSYSNRLVRLFVAPDYSGI